MGERELIDAATLAASLDDPGLRILDCRFDLGDPELGAAAYAAGHIRGARYAHLERDLSGPRTPWSGRHPLPDPAALAATFGGLGIDGTTPVVAYDEASGMYAARAWWLLRWLGHARVAVLDGGLGAWRAAGLPLSTAATGVAPRRWVPRPAADVHASADEVARLLARDACLLLDARAAERFAGRVEPLDPQAGHVPGARNHPYQRNLGSDGRFLAPAALRALFAPLLADRPPREVINMCGSGVSACHTLLALEVAGLGGARLYPGSWSEWCRDPGRPVAVGP